MTNKQIRQLIASPTQVLVTDGVDPESNLGYYGLSSIGKDLLGVTTASQGQEALALVPGTHVQAYDSDLDAIAALTTTGLIDRTGAGTATTRATGATGLAVLASADAAAARTAVGVGAITNRNRLINGGMAIDQRNNGAVQTITAGSALAYTVDRWYAYCTGANVTGQQVQGATAGRFRYRFTGASGCTAIGFGQRIEQLNSADLAGNTATLSVDLANSLLTTVTWTAFYANTADTFGTLASPTRTQIATGTFTVNSTVTRYSTQIQIPIEAVTGIEIVFTVGAQTSGTWTIGNVQLEPGSVATPFEVQNFSIESLLCFRYFENNLLMGARNAQPYGSNNLAGSVASLSFLAEKRTEPTITAVLLEGSSFIVFNFTPKTRSIIATADSGVYGNWHARLTVSAEL